MKDNTKLGILSVFLTIDGEANVYGTGIWSVFVRTRGCTVGCHWCDTKYSWSNKGGEEFYASELLEVLEDVLRKNRAEKVRKVTLTGGEPLEQDWVALYLFMRLLIDKGYHVTVETAGTQDTILFREGFKNGWPTLNLSFQNLSFVVDYKLKSSQFKGEMDPDHFANLRHGDVVKFVIDSSDDLHEASSMAHWLNKQRMFGARMYFSPSHNHIEPEMLVHKMRALGLPQIGVGLNMQMQKYIWPEDVRTEEDTGVDFTKRTLGREEYLRRIRSGDETENQVQST